MIVILFVCADVATRLDLCAAVSSSHSPGGVAFSLIFEFGDLRLDPRVVCCAETAPQPFYLSLTLPSFLTTSPGVLPSPARSRGWRGRRCRRARKLFEDGFLTITHSFPPSHFRGLRSFGPTAVSAASMTLVGR
jgi:hypothetical protein